MKKRFIVYAILPVLAGAALIGGTVFAATSQATKTSPFSALATAIAQKFNLNSTDVQTVIDQTMTAERTQMEKDRLAQAVTDGKLTQAQADLIVAKRASLEAEREANKTSFSAMTDTERQAAMEKNKADLQAWATANNVPVEYLFGGGRGHGGGHGMMGPGGNPNDAAKSTTQTSATTN